MMEWQHEVLVAWYVNEQDGSEAHVVVYPWTQFNLIHLSSGDAMWHGVARLSYFATIGPHDDDE